MEKLKYTTGLLLFLIIVTPAIRAQLITGVWTGKINRQKVEVRIILDGSNLTGTTYYYESPSNSWRYSIKGYFDRGTNEAVWWDDQLIEENGDGARGGKTRLVSKVYFDCPGYGRLILDGKASRVNDRESRGEESPDKTDWSTSTDGWDFVLENITVGAFEAEVVNGVEPVTTKKIIEDQPAKTSPIKEFVISIPKPVQTGIEFPEPEQHELTRPSVIEQKYTAREKVFATEIPLSGDSVELHFYDNAQVDGDSISLFLNDRLIFDHIRLTDKPYSIKLAVSSLLSSNELIMVAENLGSIPPNTSYMVADVGDKKYEARLESTEGSSAMIRLVKRAGD